MEIQYNRRDITITNIISEDDFKTVVETAVDANSTVVYHDNNTKAIVTDNLIPFKEQWEKRHNR